MSSVDLASFLQQVEVGGNRIDPACQAYKMDGTEPGPNMRASAGLGQCNCCDYFTFLGSALVLIEETDLRRQIKDLRKKFAQDIQKDVAQLEDHEQISVNQRVLRELKQENKLKVYGSLLVLCRLARKVGDADEAQALGRTASFWLVYGERTGGDELIFFDDLSGQLRSDLRSALTGAVVNEVKIVPAESLGAMLPTEPMMA